MTQNGFSWPLLCTPIVMLTMAQLGHARDGALDTARTTNFLIDGPNRAVAQLVSQRAESMRRQIARQWLGKELPPARKRSLIFVDVRQQESIGRSLLSPSRQGHIVWIAATHSEATGSLLAHEVAHTVLAHRFGDRMPIWANEGIASTYDDEHRHRIRARIMREMVVERTWPNLAALMESPIRSQKQYTVAASLTQFFLSRGNRSKFLDFVADGAARGWDDALTDRYGIDGRLALQRQWQQWAGRRVRDAVPRTSRPARLALASQRGQPVIRHTKFTRQ